MQVESLWIIIWCLLLTNATCFVNGYQEVQDTTDPGRPLLLTPLIKQGKIEDAQKAAAVKFPAFQDVKSYAAYFTINDFYNSNLFFWFFPSKTNYADDPVILWLQGGPGATSLFGLFTENGPFEIKPKHGMKLREYSWSESHSVIYIDNPVGTGYSFTSDGGYARNQTAIGEGLYEALLQFFQLFPDLQKNDFFIAGESYAGKYVPALGYTIYKNNPKAKQKINLQGLSVGNGFSDPEHQSDYSPYLYQIGLIDFNGKEQMAKAEREGIKCIRDKEWIKAYKVFDELIGGDSTNSTLFKNLTGFGSYFNYLTSSESKEIMEGVEKFIQLNEIRKAIHVGNTPFQAETKVVEENLQEDIMQSVAPWISELLSHYRILLYSGQLDIIVAYPLTVNFLKNLNFSGADLYKTAVRHQWYVDSELAGYVKQAGNLTEVLVRNAGHMVPTDQPRWAVDLITRFTRRKPYW